MRLDRDGVASAPAAALEEDSFAGGGLALGSG